MGKKTAEDKVNFLLFSLLHQKELFQHSSSSDKKFMTKLSLSIQEFQLLNWPKSSVKCGKMLILQPKKDWKKLIKSTKKKLLNKKPLISNNMERLKRKRRRNTLKNNDFALIDCTFLLTIVLKLCFLVVLNFQFSKTCFSLKNTHFNELIIKEAKLIIILLNKSKTYWQMN